MVGLLATQSVLLLVTKLKSELTRMEFQLVRTGPIHLEDLTAAAFEVFESEDVTLVANGFDAVRDTESGSVISPALYADVSGALQLSVSAPRGSMDVLHNGTQVLGSWRFGIHCCR